MQIIFNIRGRSQITYIEKSVPIGHYRPPTQYINIGGGIHFSEIRKTFHFQYHQSSPTVCGYHGASLPPLVNVVCEYLFSKVL